MVTDVVMPGLVIIHRHGQGVGKEEEEESENTKGMRRRMICRNLEILGEKKEEAKEKEE